MIAMDLLNLSLRFLCVGILVQSLELLKSVQLWQKSGAFREGLSEKNFRILLWMRVGLAIVVITQFFGQGQFLRPTEIGPPPTECILYILILLLIWMTNLLLFYKFRGGLTGGSDAMMNLSLTAILIGQNSSMTKACVYFIAVQCLLSYFIAGAIKVKEQDWRSGKALRIFLRLTIFDTPNWLKAMTVRLRLVQILSWILMLTEMIFPILILGRPQFLLPLFVLGVLFHLANAYLFGISRFVYSWVATYPCVFYLAKNH